MIKKFNLYEYYSDSDTEEEEKEDNYTPLEEIDNIEINDTVYHGSIRDIYDDINDLSLGYSDWDAIWVTYEEVIAREFSDLPTI